MAEGGKSGKITRYVLLLFSLVGLFDLFEVKLRIGLDRFQTARAACVDYAAIDFSLDFLVYRHAHHGAGLDPISFTQKFLFLLLFRLYLLLFLFLYTAILLQIEIGILLNRIEAA